MTTNNADLREFYRMVQGSRERVFRWLDSLPPEVFTQEHPDFAYGSLRNIYAHVAVCYRVWVGAAGLELKNWRPRIAAAEIEDVPAMRQLFSDVDSVMGQAFEQFTDLDAPLDIVFKDQPLKVTRRWLLMHPITHEFHHKGQLLALGRVLGHPYPPGPDTDLVRPFEQP